MSDTKSHETPVESLAHEIMRRTNEKAGRGNPSCIFRFIFAGDGVSSSPIILSVEYCNCWFFLVVKFRVISSSNLNIYDVPGFRLGGDEKLKVNSHSYDFLPLF